MANSHGGWYPLIDYINFKGKGVKETEKYNGEGWGLLQVLDSMKPISKGSDALKEFADSAEFVLRRRVKK